MHYAVNMPWMEMRKTTLWQLNKMSTTPEIFVQNLKTLGWVQKAHFRLSRLLSYLFCDGVDYNDAMRATVAATCDHKQRRCATVLTAQKKAWGQKKCNGVAGRV